MTSETDLPAGFNYARGKVKTAIHGLAIGPGPIKSRLLDAAITLTPISEADLPVQLRVHLRSIQQNLIAVQPQSGEGAYTASIQSMTDEDASDLARLLVELNDLLDEFRIRDGP